MCSSDSLQRGRDLVGRHVGAHQCIEFHHALREHPQLAGTIDRFGVTGGVDHLLGDLSNSLLRLHRRRAQHLVGLVLRNIAHPHEDAFGPVHELALVEAVVDVAELVAKQLVVLEARLRDVNHRAQAMQAIAIDDIGVDAGGRGARDLLGIGVGGEDDDRARRDVEEGGGAREKRIVGIVFIANDEIGGAANDLRHHRLDLRSSQDIEARRL